MNMIRFWGFSVNRYPVISFISVGMILDTVHKLAGFCERMRIDDVKIIGAPKTIDNDLMETDHCPRLWLCGEICCGNDVRNCLRL